MSDIKKIIEEIYMIDPSLKDHEPELMKIVSEFINKKPELIIDQGFISSLREKIMKEENSASPIPIEKKSGIWVWPNFAFAGAGAIVMLLIVVPFLMPENNKQDKTAKNIISPAQVKALSSNAFGKLEADGRETAPQTEQGEVAMAGKAQPSALAPMASRTMGMGGGTFLADADTKATSSQSEIRNDILDTKMIPDMVAPMSYAYKFKGEAPELKAGEAPVYKRVASRSFSQAVGNIANNVDLGIFDLGRLESARVQTLMLAEDKDYGMMVNIMVAESTIEFFQNYERWQSYYPKCDANGCEEWKPLGINEILSDEEALAKAAQFLSQYGISTQGYGEPQVRNEWRRLYDLARDKTSFYIPEDSQVIYPLLVEGQPVSDANGYPQGLSVSVSSRFDRVTGMSGYRINDFESSAYELESDFARILKIAERGGQYPIYYFSDQKPETVEVELGTPTQSLMSHWHYDEASGQSYELFVPALVFPITKTPANDQYFYQQSVVVPLVKDILDDYEAIIDRPIMEPMPMLKGGDTPAAEAVTTDMPATKESETAEPLLKAE